MQKKNPSKKQVCNWNQVLVGEKRMMTLIQQSHNWAYVMNNNRYLTIITIINTMVHQAKKIVRREL